jgi:hypothetical protein
MRVDVARTSIWWRRLTVAAIAVFGIVTIVGSGGGFMPDSNFNFNGPFAPTAGIEPYRVTVQVGAMVTFTAIASGTPPFAYQWSRNGADIAGATGTSYTLVGANLTDDGAQIAVRVTNGVGTSTASSLLRVSSMPGVLYQDAEFQMSDWAVTAIANPALNGPTYAASRSATGGNPDAYRAVDLQVTQGPSAIRVFHTSLSSTYDPPAQGAIYTIDVALDCNRLSPSTISDASVSPAFEQGGRWFVPPRWITVCQPNYWARGAVLSLSADEFILAAGPSCGTNQACPDFSAGAMPMRLGFVSAAALPSGSASSAITLGIDNWKVTVWRR